MQRLSVPLLLVIALLAGVTGGLLLDQPSVPRTPVSAAGETDTALVFYDALNRALAGEGADRLASLLSPAFRNHDAASGVSTTTEEFLRGVRERGQTPDGSRIEVVSVEASGSVLIVQVRPVQSERAIAGTTITQSREAPDFDILRVSRGTVVDRWTAGAWWLDTTTFDELAFPVAGIANRITSLMRVEIPAGAEHQWTPSMSGLLLVESGPAVVAVRTSDGQQSDLRLEAGNAIAFRPRERIRLRSDDGTAFSVLVYTTAPVTAGEPYVASVDDAPEAGVTESLLWRGQLDHADITAVHGLGTILLPAGETVQLTLPTDANVIVALDSGALEVAAPERAVTMLDDDLWPMEQANYAQFNEHRAVVVTGANELIVRNPGDHAVRVVLIAIAPDTSRVER